MPNGTALQLRGTRSWSKRTAVATMTLILAAASVPGLLAQSAAQSRAIVFPDVPGYRTLKCDLHTHSVFSDGSVWPDIRIEEAQRDGLDAISLTEHLEYQPHEDDIPHPDRNRAHNLGLEYAAGTELIVIRGSEITRRELPPGHSNAIFIEDANKLLNDDVLEVFREAKRQGAFVFWNHPHWEGQQRDGIARLNDFQRLLIREDLVQGIEVINDVTYSDEALEIAGEQNLTILGTSDIHGLVDWNYDIPGGGHRPITLVFAKERSEAGIEEGLRAGRTVAWLDDLIVGKTENLVPLIEASLSLTEAKYSGKQKVLEVFLENSSSGRFVLRNMNPWRLHNAADVITVPPRGRTALVVKTGERRESIDLKFEVLSAVDSPRHHPQVVIGPVPVEIPPPE